MSKVCMRCDVTCFYGVILRLELVSLVTNHSVPVIFKLYHAFCTLAPTTERISYQIVKKLVTRLFLTLISSNGIDCVDICEQMGSSTECGTSAANDEGEVVHLDDDSGPGGGAKDETHELNVIGGEEVSSYAFFSVSLLLPSTPSSSFILFFSFVFHHVLCWRIHMHTACPVGTATVRRTWVR